MEIKYRKAPVCIDFNDFIHQLEEEKGYKYRDMAGKYSKEASEEKEINIDNWLVDNGYAGKRYVLDRPEGSNEDWAKDSPEMALRVEIGNKLWDHMKQFDRPYQDVWHWLLHNAFENVKNGCEEYLHISFLNNKPDWYDDDTMEFSDTPNPDYVERVLQDIFEACKDSPAFDGEGINFYIWW